MSAHRGFNPFLGFSSSETREVYVVAFGVDIVSIPSSGFLVLRLCGALQLMPEKVVSIPSSGFLVLRRCLPHSYPARPSGFNPFLGFSSSETVVASYAWGDGYTVSIPSSGFLVLRPIASNLSPH